MENWNIRVTKIGEKKIQTIKEIRTYTGWGLKDSKDWVDDVASGITRSFLPQDLAYGTPKDFYEALAYQGCEVELIYDVPDDDELPPLSVMELAVKLALKGYDHKSARSLADALNGIEDASGSLRAAALIMESVA